MSRIRDSLKHGGTAYLFAISKGVQKAAYYGFRAILVFFLMDQIALERSQSLSYYGIFTGAYLFLQVITSLVSDLIQQNRNVMLCGGVIQVIGFTLMGLSDQIWMLGMLLVAIGGAMFEDNQTSFFGKLYRDKKPLLDAGFAILITMVNVGAMLGIVILGYLYEAQGHKFSFFLAAVIMSCAVYIMYRYEATDTLITTDAETRILDDNLIDSEYIGSKQLRSNSSSNWIFGLILAILIVYVTIPLSEDVFAMQVSVEEYSSSLLSSLGSFMAMIFGAILAIVWSYRYSSQYSKMIIAVAIFLFFYVLIKNSDLLLGGSDGLVLFIGFTALYELSFAVMAPVIYSFITEYANPKYYATFFACSRIPEKLLFYFGLAYTTLQGLNQFVGIGVLIVLGLAACVLQFTRKETV